MDANNPTGYAQVLEEKDAVGVVTRTCTLRHDVIAQQAPGTQGGDPTFIGRFSTNSGMDLHWQIPAKASEATVTWD